MPLLVETLGGWHPTALKVLNKLARQLAQNIGREDTEVQNHFFQWLGILLMKGNVSLLLSRVLSYAPQHIDGDREF